MSNLFKRMSFSKKFSIFKYVDFRDLCTSQYYFHRQNIFAAQSILIGIIRVLYNIL